MPVDMMNTVAEIRCTGD